MRFETFRNFLIVSVSTFGYIGFLPLIPGTFGSIAGLLVFYLFQGNPQGLFFSAAAIIVLGFMVGTEAERLLKKKDAPCIVIDEVAGMLVALAFIPYDLRLVAAAFLVFRILDTLKPYPAARLQELKGGIGIMSDDLVTGLYTNIILQLGLRIASFKLS